MNFIELYARFQACLQQLLKMSDAVREHPQLREVMRVRMMPIAEEAVGLWKQLTK